MSNPPIRRAIPADASQLARCMEHAYARDAERIPDLPAMSEGLDQDIADNIVWVSERDGHIVGGLVLGVQQLLDRNTRRYVGFWQAMDRVNHERAAEAGEEVAEPEGALGELAMDYSYGRQPPRKGKHGK